MKHRRPTFIYALYSSMKSRFPATSFQELPVRSSRPLFIFFPTFQHFMPLNNPYEPVWQSVMPDVYLRHCVLKAIILSDLLSVTL